MDRTAMIEAAKEWIGQHWQLLVVADGESELDYHARLMADFALSLFQWKQISTADDLPKGQSDAKYLVTDGEGSFWGAALGPEQLDGYHAKIKAYIPIPIPQFKEGE